MIKTANRFDDAITEDFVYKDNNLQGKNNIPLRHLKSVSVYNRRGEFVKVDEIERLGPLAATGVAVACPDLLIKNDRCLVYLDTISEYSLEYPYGKQAIIWLKSSKAHYAVDSLSPEYLGSGKANFFKEASVCGQVINAFINSAAGRRQFTRVISNAQLLCRMNTLELFEILSARRLFLLDQFAQQSLKGFNHSQMYKTLKDDELWSPRNIKRLIGAVNRHTTAVRARTQSLISSDGEIDDRTKHQALKPKPVDNTSPRTSIDGKSWTADELDTTSTTSSEDKPPNDFAIAPCTINSQTFQLPTEMALHFDCPFCCLTLKRAAEEFSIVDLTIEHIQQHLQNNKFKEPVGVAAHAEMWPNVSPKNRTCSIILGTLRIKDPENFDNLPLGIVDLI